MKGKTVSVWLKGKDLRRFQAEADKRGVLLATFLRQAADEALIPLDPSHDFKQLAADLRADVAKSLSRFTEAAALAHEKDRQEQLAFRAQLFEEQVETVKKAVAAGQGPRHRSSPDFPPSTQPSPSLTPGKHS